MGQSLPEAPVVEKAGEALQEKRVHVVRDARSAKGEARGRAPGVAQATWERSWQPVAGKVRDFLRSFAASSIPVVRSMQETDSKIPIVGRPVHGAGRKKELL